MEKAPAFQFYAQDFLTGVMYLTNEEIGIYIKMLAKQWTDKQIPKKRLGFLVGFEWENLSDELKSKFKDMGEYIVNERLEKERDKKERFFEKQVINGKKGGRPKKNSVLKTQTKPKKSLYEDEDEIEVVIEYNNSLKKSEKTFLPTIEEFLEYGKEITGDAYYRLEPAMILKYESWRVNDWKTGGKNPRKIKNWKNTLANTIPHLKPTEETKGVNAGELLKREYGYS